MGQRRRALLLCRALSGGWPLSRSWNQEAPLWGPQCSHFPVIAMVSYYLGPRTKPSACGTENVAVLRFRNDKLPKAGRLDLHPQRVDRCLRQASADTGGPKDQMNIRILRSGSKSHHRGDTRNKCLWDPCVYLVFWAPNSSRNSYKYHADGSCSVTLNRTFGGG